MFHAEGGWVEGRQRSHFSPVILQCKGKVLGGSGRNGVCGRSVLLPSQPSCSPIPDAEAFSLLEAVGAGGAGMWR